ncbi:FimB/Mfa2 family fimbrial subunit [Bacteroides ovatus]|nr:FimB/Mfa2 family fimbrial subunit [Bacteroides ovatus]
MGIKRHIKKYKIILAAFIVAGITGCDVLHDDLDQCDLFLKFRYDYNMANKDWFAEQVEEVKVFVFDTQGKYIQTLTDNGKFAKKSGLLYADTISFERLYSCCMGWKNG